MSEQVTEHPEELLAEYAEGVLGPEDRARVEAHLAGCGRCREEVALAREAITALSATPEVAPPPGLDLAVRRRSRGPSRRVWVAAGAAAAAAGVIVAAIVVFGPQAGDPTALSGGGGAGAGGPQESTQERTGTQDESLAGAPPLPQSAEAVLVQETDRDYTAASLATLGRRLRDSARASLEQDRALADTAQRFFASFEIDELPGATRAAVNCVFDEVPPDQLLVPYAIQEAAFEGEPAYVAAFLQGPSPDTPYDRLLIWVVDRDSCALLYYAAHQL